MAEIRTERRFGVTSRLDPAARSRLFSLRVHAGWDDLLDLLEMVCIEQESVLINTDEDKESSIIARHRMTKAAWQMFVHFQERIDREIKLFLEEEAETATTQPVLTPEEAEQENITNPLRYLPQEGEV
jgi:hypothetical protein